MYKKIEPTIENIKLLSELYDAYKKKKKAIHNQQYIIAGRFRYIEKEKLDKLGLDSISMCMDGKEIFKTYKKLLREKNIRILLNE